jgi:hypothetical protein
MRTIADAIERIRDEFLEMPGLCLTAPQVQRLCGVELTLCHAVLESLVDAKFLHVKSDGTYQRLTDGAIARRTTVKAVPRPEPPFGWA